MTMSEGGEWTPNDAKGWRDQRQATAHHSLLLLRPASRLSSVVFSGPSATGGRAPIARPCTIHKSEYVNMSWRRASCSWTRVMNMIDTSCDERVSILIFSCLTVSLELIPYYNGADT